MILRYEALLQSSGAAGLHGALPPSVFKVLHERLGVTAEGFASPLNTHFGKAYFSVFGDTSDRWFGSLGSFFCHRQTPWRRLQFSDGGARADPRMKEAGSNGGAKTNQLVLDGGSFECNPPFGSANFVHVALQERIKEIFDQADLASPTDEDSRAIPRAASVDSGTKRKHHRTQQKHTEVLIHFYQPLNFFRIPFFMQDERKKALRK